MFTTGHFIISISTYIRSQLLVCQGKSKYKLVTHHIFCKRCCDWGKNPSAQFMYLDYVLKLLSLVKTHLPLKTLLPVPFIYIISLCLISFPSPTRYGNLPATYCLLQRVTNSLSSSPAASYPCACSKHPPIVPKVTKGA